MSRDRLMESCGQVNSRKDLVIFIETLCADYLARPSEWENIELARYLESVAAWIEDMDGYFPNVGESFDETPTWKILAQALLAGKIYE